MIEAAPSPTLQIPLPTPSPLPPRIRTGMTPATVDPSMPQLFVTVKATFPNRSLPTIKAKLDECLELMEGLGMHIRVCVFDHKDNLPEIQRISAIGHHLTQLRQYFSGLSLSTTSWSQWRLSWRVDPNNPYSSSDFLNDLHASVEPLNFVFYPKRLQAPFTTTVGWMFKTSDRTNCTDLHAFLKPVLERLGFTVPFALYHKVPFAGAAKPATSTPSAPSAPAVHIDTIAGSSQRLYQLIKNILKGPHLSRYTNWKWKLFPVLQKDLDQSDQRELLTVMAKQKILKKSIASGVINTVLDLDILVDDTTTVRSFLLHQLPQPPASSSQTRPIVLGIDRDPHHPSTLTATSSMALRADLLHLIHFLPILLTHHYGKRGQAALSEEGLFLLEDQYWDSVVNRPRSRFSDDLCADHERDDGDIVIILDDLPKELLEGASSGTIPFPLDSDSVTHASFNTLGHRRPTLPPPAVTVPFQSTPEPTDPSLSSLRRQMEHALTTPGTHAHVLEISGSATAGPIEKT